MQSGFYLWHPPSDTWYNGRGEWVSNAAEAFNFYNLGSAINGAREHYQEGIKIVEINVHGSVHQYP